MSLRLGSLCTGYGGLEMAVDAVLDTETVWYSELDPYAARVCAARFPGVPNVGDITAVAWEQVEPVDVLTAGYPCQPFSIAGKRRGVNDERHLWPHIADAVRVLRPRFCFLENVAAHLRVGLDAVLADLAGMGFDAEWGVLPASDVGAPHGRARLFCVAADASGDAGWLSDGDGGVAADPDGSGLEGRRRAGVDGADERAVGPHRVAATADPDSAGGQTHHRRPRGRAAGRPQLMVGGGPDWGEYAPAVRRWERTLGRSAPAPTDGGRLSPLFVEFLMGLPEGWVTDVPGLSRNVQLKALGNGVVPQCAAAAYRVLLERLGSPMLEALR